MRSERRRQRKIAALAKEVRTQESKATHPMDNQPNWMEGGRGDLLLFCHESRRVAPRDTAVCLQQGFGVRGLFTAGAPDSS